MKNMSIFGRFVCTVSYSDRTSESFCATIQKRDLLEENIVAGDVNTILRLIGSGKLQEAIQNINKNMVVGTSGLVDKKITDCNISFSGQVVVYGKRNTIVEMVPFGTVVMRDRSYNLSKPVDDSKSDVIGLIQAWIDQIITGF